MQCVPVLAFLPVKRFFLFVKLEPSMSYSFEFWNIRYIWCYFVVSPLEKSPSWMLLLGGVVQSGVLTAVSFLRNCNA